MKRLVLVGVVLALVCAAGGSASSPGGQASAARGAQRLLDAYVPPKGAVRLKAVPKGEHSPPGAAGGTLGKSARRHRLWLVHLPARSLQKYFYRRLRGWHAIAFGSSRDKRVVTRTGATFTAPGFSGRVTGRWLSLTAVRARRAGWSLLRADVAVVWHLSATEREELPAGVREVDIWGPPHGYRLANVTNPGQVRTIVRWFDHLQLNEMHVLSCGVALRAPTFTFEFKDRDGTLARAIVPQLSGPCSPARLIIRGHEQRFGLLAGNLGYRVQKLLGANWIGPMDVFGHAEKRRGKAANTAAALMHAFKPPPGASRIHKPKGYGGVLISIPGPFGEFEQRTRYWHVAADPASVVSFLQAHDKPPGFKGDCGSNPRFGSARCSLNAGRSRYLEFAVQRTRDGSSILRVDAQVVWVYPRSPKESVRASRVREIDFSAPKVSKHVTDPGKIARIVRWFNRIPILPPGTGTSPGCGLVQTVPVTLDFRGTGGKLLAHVSADVTEPQGGTSACNPMIVTIAGASQPALYSDNFFGRVQRLLGVTVS